MVSWAEGWLLSPFHLQSITKKLPQGPEEPEDNKLDVRRTYHITQKGRYLSVYLDYKGLPSKRIMKFDMLRPSHRQAFLNVRHLAVERYPPGKYAPPAKQRDLLRVQASSRHLPRCRSTQQSIIVGTAGKLRSG